MDINIIEIHSLKLSLQIDNVLTVLIIYITCVIFRIIEYFFIKTDFTFIGEAILHKLIGIGILYLSAKYFSYKKEDIGFKGGKILLNIIWGLLFGLFCFGIAYLTEVLILKSSNNFDYITLAVTSYYDNGNSNYHTNIIFFIICFIGNIINVLMEEGVFRGLFPKILDKKYKFIISALISSILFGLWHIVGPLRSYMDGTNRNLMNGVILVSTSALVGFKFALITKMTGSLYFGMSDHFVNNTIVNILHVMPISEHVLDGYQTLRISIAQTLSFIIVLIVYFFYTKKNNKKNKRNSSNIEI
ncbi:CAAX protease self-immunity [Anaeromyces robustus]|uniref:CAAX protease self-immunity n=1 Tax=Anaeromyces robustus TaxID=1754192 RepID=A0A1Y1XJE5_9FUNG|nr:CAAX protease self-immunity [Anaeromyces robustus]|eukprot:ORX85865.1 CAAX protease self-immunity [Anaeromyces robustus]